MIATTATERTDQLRHEGVRRTLALIVAGDTDAALDTLLASVADQARLNGVRV